MRASSHAKEASKIPTIATKATLLPSALREKPVVEVEVDEHEVEAQNILEEGSQSVQDTEPRRDTDGNDMTSRDATSRREKGAGFDEKNFTAELEGEELLANLEGRTEIQMVRKNASDKKAWPQVAMRTTRVLVAFYADLNLL